MKKQLINPAGYTPVSVTGITVDGSTMNVEKSDGTTESQQLPAGGGSGSDTDIVEVKDTVTTVHNADQHVITATEGNGTENEVGRFIIAPNQIVNSYPSTGQFNDTQITLVTINQDGNFGSMNLPSEFGNVVTDQTISFTLPETFSHVLVYCLFQNPASNMYIPFSISREMLDKLGTEITFTGSHTNTPTEYVCSKTGIMVYPASSSMLSNWANVKPYICTMLINKTSAYVKVQTHAPVTDIQLAFI